jgi:hypothetical protein
LEDPGLDGRAIFKMDQQEVGWGGLDWIDLAQDKDRCSAVVKAVMNLWAIQNARNLLTS